MSFGTFTFRAPGVHFTESGTTELTVWAPFAKEVKLIIVDEHHSENFDRVDHGYWTITSQHLKPGSNYWIALDGKNYPDPASLYQPQGLHGPSQAIDLNDFSWSDDEWYPHQLKDYIIYELHTGTFSPTGTFEGVAERLDYLIELGINAIEIMPVAQFPGVRNWGYDGALPFAVHHSYGGPRALQHLVNECHRKNIAVILDVVINHLGPEGNHLGAFGPYFTDKYKTPWGLAINFDDAGSDAVRHYFVHNIVTWLRDYHIDAIRLDAVHALRDFSPVHILAEIRHHVNEVIATTGRARYLIAECDLNDTRYITSIEESGYGMDAQWVDEFHHALRVTTGQARTGYYSDFTGLNDLASSFQQGYVYTGNFSPHRDRLFGTDTQDIPGESFVVFSQNHDQVGNRMLGERSSHLAGFELAKLMVTAVMVSPFVPMLFMGEEWAEPHPFLYFVNHTEPALVKAVREGRRKEFQAFFNSDEFPDPQDEQTFLRSKLDWSLMEVSTHSAMFAFYKELIATRKKYSAIASTDRTSVHVLVNEESKMLMVTKASTEQRMCCVMNFSDLSQPIIIHNRHVTWTPLLYTADERWSGPASGLLPMEETSLIAPQSAAIWITDHV